jgi:hypothetical protein
MDVGPERRYIQPQDLNQWHLLKPSLKKLGVRWRTGAELQHRLLNHCTARQTTGGVWYYQTIRRRDEKNRFYLLWNGESIQQLEAAMSELRFLYDHLPGIDWWLVSPQLNKGGYRAVG